MGPFRVTVRRGTVVEAVHLAHAVAVEDERIVDSAGDPELLAFFRSSSKPLLAEVAGAADVPPNDIPTAVDGCGVPTFALTLERMAASFARLAHLSGGGRIAAAMSSHPELIGYERGAIDNELMRLRPGWVAKGGAEGLICAASPEGVGFAIKIEDGNMRALRPALASFLGLGLGLGKAFAVVPIENSLGDVVGEVAAE